MAGIKFKTFPELSYATAEAINTLCINLTFSGAETKVILMTSCHASEGKSFVSMNVFRTMAGLGQKVVLVDLDLRRSMIMADYSGTYTEDASKLGVTHFLAGKCDIEDIVYETNINNGCYIPVGRTVSNSLPLCKSPKLKELIDELRSQFDYIIVDAPPIGATIDAAEIAKSCDGIVLIATYGDVNRHELIDAKHQLDQSGCRILGAVINQAEIGSYMNRKYYYKKYYKHYGEYYTEPSEPEKKKKRK